MKLSCIPIFALLLITSSAAGAFYDDFSDTDISDWEPRCAPGIWYSTMSMVYGSTGSTPSALAPVAEYMYENCEITMSVKGGHAFGMIARLNDGDSGVIAYVSPDHQVARIRLVSAGSLSTILTYSNLPIPLNEWLELTFELNGPNLTFTIHVPSTSDTWVLNAYDPNPQPGTFGLLMGDEPGTYWDWISVVEGPTGVEETGSAPIQGPSLCISPNPFYSSLTITVSGMDNRPLAMEVYDLSGHLLASPEFDTGGSDRSLFWDGRCSDGSILPSGVYIARLTGTDRFVRTLVKL